MYNAKYSIDLDLLKSEPIKIQYDETISIHVEIADGLLNLSLIHQQLISENEYEQAEFAEQKKSDKKINKVYEFIKSRGKEGATFRNLAQGSRTFINASAMERVEILNILERNGDLFTQKKGKTTVYISSCYK